MAVFQVTGPDGGVYEIEAPDTASESDVLEFAKQQFSAQQSSPPEQDTGGRNLTSLITGRNKASEAAAVGARYASLFGDGPARQSGRELNSSAQGGLAALQGPLFGFADEIAGAGSAFAGLTRGDLDVVRNYQDGRGLVRGATQKAGEDRPIFTAATQFATAAPLMAIGGAAPVAAPSASAVATGRTVGVLNSMARAGSSAALSGGVNAAGNSEAEDLSGLLADTGKGAATSAALGIATVPAAMMMGKGRQIIGAAFDKSSADDLARQKVAEALLRDAQGTAFQGGQLPVGSGVYKVGASSPIDQARARLGKLGDDAALVDAGRENSADLLDAVGSLPGRAKNMLERFKTARVATRGARMAGAADDALGVSGKYSDDIGGFVAQREMDAAPLYAKAYAEAPPIIIPKNILMRDSVVIAYKKAQDMAMEQGFKLPPMNPSAVQPIPPLSLPQADFLKRAMDDVLYKAKMPDSSVGKEGYKLMQATRRALVQSIDEQAGPAYAKARAAFAGPTQSIEAAELGRDILKEDVLSIKQLTEDLFPEQMDAFRVGVAQAIREKAGTMGGQNYLLRMWREPATADKLKAVFGNDFRKFQASVLAEKSKKGVEELGKAGSRTFRREAGNEDLGVAVIGDATTAAAEAKGGNIVGMFGALRNAGNRLSMPELTRERIAKMLLTQGPKAGSELDQLVQTLVAIQRGKAGLAQGYGIAAGSAVGPYAQGQRPPIH